MNSADKPSRGDALRARFDLHRGMAELAADLALALSVLLLLAVAFMAWQAWLIARQSQATQALTQDKVQAVQKVAAALDLQRRKVDEALASPTLHQALASNDAAGRDRAAQLLRTALPQARAVMFYSADDILGASLQKLGYARAEQLTRALSSGAATPLEVRALPPQTLSFVQPVDDARGTALAYAAVELPFTRARAAFESIEMESGRLDLRQGDGSGDLVLATRGDQGLSTQDDAGLPIPHSRLRIAAAPPAYWLPVTQSLASALLLAVLAFVAGLGLLVARSRVRSRGAGTNADAAATPTAAPAGAAAIPPVKEAAEGKEHPPEVAAVAKPATTAVARPAAIERSIFRAYDIRGVVGSTLTQDTARLIGQAIGSVMRDKNLSEIVIGRDGRLSGPQLSGALSDGLRAAGIDVIDIGPAATPLVYFASFHLNTGSCVAVTGSHNPPDYNGFKIVVGGETLAEDAIQDLYARIAENRLATGQGTLRQMDVSADYVQRIAGDIQTGRSLKVVVDCGNGIPGAIAPEVIHAIGCEVTPLYCEVDGNFPNHHPDPSEPANLADLILMVKKTGADLGLAFDGDGDRLGVVTKDGEIIYPDRLLMLFAMDVLIRNPGATIIYDVKCTGHLQPMILKAGGSPLMWKTGHSLIKAKMRETGAQLAGEMSGHFFFRERWYGFDDGIYSAARLLEILADDPAGRTPEQIFATLPKGVSTPELKVPMREGEHYTFIERFRERAQFEGARLTTIDGLRADWPDGWGLVRASNTTPVLVLRFDADDKAALDRIQGLFRAQLLAVDSSLQLPF
ncbi:MAG TPA: phosphomannomutase/phosphoglucomutase [Rhodanobacteraceae bacterium]|nr:phosphomannomutase/phosphoglucomutase [Rhodanobacteraceae bacterium]